MRFLLVKSQKQQQFLVYSSHHVEENYEACEVPYVVLLQVFPIILKLNKIVLKGLRILLKLFNFIIFFKYNSPIQIYGHFFELKE